MKNKNLNTAAIVMPTYNEASNIKLVLDKIYENEKKQKDVKIYVLVVDDNSPDGTAKIVEEYKKKNKKVSILKRKEKEGLGVAYIEGIKHAIKSLNPDILFEMDADGQHNPNDIFNFIKAIEESYDFVIGSRYIEGGSIEGKWALHRKIISFMAGYITKKGLGLEDIKDPSGGFRAMRRDIFEKINLDNLDVKGYAFQASLLEAVVFHKFRIKEIPITFNQRLQGESKMGFSDALEGFVVVFRTRWKRFRGNGP